MGCGATKVQVQEEEQVLSSEDKTEDCRFFCPLCMLFYERKAPRPPIFTLSAELTMRFVPVVARNAEGQLLRSVHMCHVCYELYEGCVPQPLQLHLHMRVAGNAVAS